MKRSIFAVLVFSASIAAACTPRAEAQTQGNLVNFIYGLQICTGPYALCAASTCTPVNSGTITVNTARGTASFPSATCTCPVFNGPAIADPNGGNMQGSCAAPGPGQVWSLYSLKTHIPQAINNWSHKPSQTAAPFQLCSSTDDVGASYANCFSFACTIDPQRHNGVKTATCTCPLGENADGDAVDPATAVVTPAGQCDSNICSEHPVGLGLPALNSDADACIGSPTPSNQITLD
jgi:hypothetical protein